MSYYPFAPLSHFNQNNAYLHWRNGFTNEEIDKRIGDNIEIKKNILQKNGKRRFYLF